MKLKIFAVIMIVLLGCKSTGQIPKPPVVVIISDGSLVPLDSSHSQLKVIPEGIVSIVNDTIVMDFTKFLNGNTPIPSSIPRFQTLVATAGQTKFNFAIPGVYFVFKNGLLISKNKAYTVEGNTITILSPARVNDEIKVVRLE